MANRIFEGANIYQEEGYVDLSVRIPGFDPTVGTVSIQVQGSHHVDILVSDVTPTPGAAGFKLNPYRPGIEDSMYSGVFRSEVKEKIWVWSSGSNVVVGAML